MLALTYIFPLNSPLMAVDRYCHVERPPFIEYKEQIGRGGQTFWPVRLRLQGLVDWTNTAREKKRISVRPWGVNSCVFDGRSCAKNRNMQVFVSGQVTQRSLTAREVIVQMCAPWKF